MILGVTKSKDRTKNTLKHKLHVRREGNENPGKIVEAFYSVYEFDVEFVHDTCNL